jgi:hypothetical protein
MRIGPPQQGHGSRRVSGMTSALGVCGSRSGVSLSKKVADPGDVGLAGGAGKQAVMPDAVEAVGQDVDQEPADELVRGEPHDRSAGRRS